ncbi:MAG: hypothetical protein ABSF95_00555 [Verrucomicrobiota bacterium]|jgi:hypothetical protein
MSFNFWQARVEDWHLVLADFSVAEQPGHKPGDRGQNVTMANKKTGLMLLSDGIMFHQVAKWLLERMEQFGAGKTGAAWRN